MGYTVKISSIQLKGDAGEDHILEITPAGIELGLDLGFETDVHKIILPLSPSGVECGAHPDFEINRDTTVITPSNGICELGGDVEVLPYEAILEPPGESGSGERTYWNDIYSMHVSIDGNTITGTGENPQAIIAGTRNASDEKYFEIEQSVGTGQGLVIYESVPDGEMPSWGFMFDNAGGCINLATGMPCSDSTGVSYGNGDIVQIAVSEGEIYLGVNGTWVNSGSPAKTDASISGAYEIDFAINQGDEAVAYLYEDEFNYSIPSGFSGETAPSGGTGLFGGVEAGSAGVEITDGFLIAFSGGLEVGISNVTILSSKTTLSLEAAGGIEFGVGSFSIFNAIAPVTTEGTAILLTAGGVGASGSFDGLTVRIEASILDLLGSEDVATNIKSVFSEAAEEIGLSGTVIRHQLLGAAVQDSFFTYEGLSTMWGKTAESQLALSSDPTAQHGILARDFINISGENASRWSATVEAESALGFSDYAERVRVAVAEVQEILDLGILTSTQLIALVREALRVRETIVPSAHFAIGAFDSVLLADKAVCSWVATLLETLDMQVAAPVVQFSRGAVDAFLLSDTAGVTAFGQSAITDRLDMQDAAPLAQWLEAVNEALESGDAVSVQSIFFRHIADPMELSDAGNTSLFSSRGVADQLAVSDRAGVALLALAQSVLDLAGGSAAIFRAVKAVDESLELSDEGVIVRKSYLAAQDLLALGDLMAANGSYSVSVQDSFRIDVHLVFAGEDGEVWECYVLNTSNFQPSVYTGFSFNSFCTFEGRTFGAGRDGIYEIAGSTDDGEEIPTGAVLSQTNFAIPNRKRFRRAYLGVSGDTPVMAMATEDGTGIIYEITEDQTVNATRAMVGKKWTLTVADFDQLDFISLVPVILARGR